MSRTTRKQVEGMFERFVATLPTPPDGADYLLDYAPTYGGYCVRLRNADTSESSPFGDARHGASAMWDVLYFAAHAAEIASGARDAAGRRIGF